MSTAETGYDLVLEGQEPKIKKEQALPPNVATLLQAAAGLDAFGERTPWGDIFVSDLTDSVEEEGPDGSAKRHYAGTIVKGDSLKTTGELDLSSTSNKQFSASVIGIPSMTQNNSGIIKEALSLAFQRANIQLGKKDKEVKVPFTTPSSGKKGSHTELVDIPSKSGVVICIENRAPDANDELRKELMQGLGYRRVKVFTDKKHPDRTIWVGFRQRNSEREPISGTTFQDTTTGDILLRDRQGNGYRSDLSSEDERKRHKLVLQEEKERIRRETLDERGRTEDPRHLSPKDISELLANKEGFVRQDLTCPHSECGNHPIDKFTSTAKDTRFWLYLTTVCNGAHRNGLPAYFEGSTTDKPYRYRGAYGWIKKA